MKTCLLGETIASSRSGFASGKRTDDGVVQMRMNNVTIDGTLDLSVFIRVPATKRQLSELTLTPGDVLFNCTNSPDLVGKTCLFRGFAEPVAFSNHFIRLRTRPELLMSNYLAHWLVWTRNRGVFSHGCIRWVNQAAFRKDDLLRLRIPLPSVAEQKRIAEILDAADALRGKRRESIAQLDTLLQSAFLDMFGDPIANPMTWDAPPLADFCKTGTGGTPSRRKMQRYYEGGTIPWVKSGELREGVIKSTGERITEAALEETSVKLVPKGALLIALYGATVGRLGVLGVEATTNQAVCHITPDPNRADSRYIFHALASQVSYLVSRGVGGAQPNISQGIVKSLAIPLPPLNLQRRFATIVESIDKQKDLMRTHLAELDTLFASLQQRAFNGEL